MNKKVEIIIEAIERLKGEETLVLDFEGKSSLCDYNIITTARSDRNGKAIAEEISMKLKEIEVEKLNMDGYDEGNWILLDYDDVMVHILLEETREYYKLEELWSYAKEINKGN